MADQAVSLTHLSDSYSKTQSDLNDIRHIVNETNLTQDEVVDILNKKSEFDYLKLDTNRISLQTINLIFKDSRLVKIQETE